MNFLPSSSETLSILAVYLSSLLVLSVMYVLLSILTLQLLRRDDHHLPVPKSLQTAVVFVEKIACLGSPNTHRTGVMRVLSVNEKNESSKAPKDISMATEQRMYRDPPEMAWKRVSQTLDKLFFRLFFLLISVAFAVMVLKMT